MTILAQSLLALVCGHLVTLLLFSVWHSCKNVYLILNSCCSFLFVVHAVDEALAGLEGGEVVGLDNHCGVLGDVAGGLLGTMLDDEAAEATQIHILLVVSKTGTDFLHECLYNDGNFLRINACSAGD